MIFRNCPGSPAKIIEMMKKTCAAGRRFHRLTAAHVFFESFSGRLIACALTRMRSRFDIRCFLITIRSAMPPAPVDYAIVGGLRDDYSITPDGVAHLHQLGGNALYSAVGARLWARPPAARVGLVARVGANFPTEWLAEITQHGMDVGGVVIRLEELDTRTFYAYRSLEVRDDTDPAEHFARIGQPLPAALLGYANSTEGQDDLANFSPLGVRPQEVAPHYLAGRAFHLAPYDFSVHASLPGLVRQNPGRVLTCDPSIRYMQPKYAEPVGAIIRQLDAFLPSEMETRSFFGGALDDLWAAAEAFGDLGAGCVVLKLGARGQFVYDALARRRWHVPAYPSRVVDVTGAGDAYCGGFLVGLAETGDPMEAALRGSVSASFTVEGTGALYALQGTPAQLQARLEELRPAVKAI
jgi:sugar/nucleoside kinase (ribokinase family)